MNKCFKLLAVLSLCVSLCGCGGSSSPTPTPTPTEKTEKKESTKKEDKKEQTVRENDIEPVANLDPSILHPGQNYLRDFTTSDLWISDSNEEDYFYLEYASKKYYSTGFSIYWFYDGEEILSAESNDIKNKHLVSVEESNLEFDLVFIDLFTAYDYVSDQWYRREGMEALDVESLFFDQSVQSEKGNSLVFYDDYTADEVWNNEEGTGTWWAINSTQIVYIPSDNNNNEYVFDYYVKNGVLDQIDCFEMGTYYVVD